MSNNCNMSIYCNFCGSFKHATSSCKLELGMAPYFTAGTILNDTIYDKK